jgi:hypothetical protein
MLMIAILILGSIGLYALIELKNWLDNNEQ